MVVLVFRFHPFGNMISSMNSFFLHNDIDTYLSLNIPNMPLMCYFVKGWLFKGSGVGSAKVLVEGNRIIEQCLQAAEERECYNGGFLVKEEAIFFSTIQHCGYF